VGCAVPCLSTRRRKAKPEVAMTTHLRESGTVCWWARVLVRTFVRESLDVDLFISFIILSGASIERAAFKTVLRFVIRHQNRFTLIASKSEFPDATLKN
jgi:hypothetical protein